MPSDPGYAALRRATRAAIVIPLAFAFAELLLREPQSLVFVTFGFFSLLVISDFGGFRRPRAIAYLSATVVGAALVALGTLASSSPWLAAAVMLVVAFVISFSRIFGGYFVAAYIGMLLAFVIAVTIPAPAGMIPVRVGGWALAGLVSTVSAVTLWPGFDSVTTYHQAAKALLAVADLIQGKRSAEGGRDMTHLDDMARQNVEAARQKYARTAKRPAGPGRRERAFAQMLIELDRIIQIIDRPFTEHRAEVRTGLVEGDRLVACIVSLLRSTAGVLTGGAPPDLHAIDLAREEHRAARDRWAAQQLRAGRPVDQVLDGLAYEDTHRVISFLTFSLGRNAMAASGAKLDAAATAANVARAIRSHLQPRSTVLQDSLRVAIGLSLAVWVARTFDLSHAFWVVLGTIQVLRSNALGTSRSIVLALIGNAIGVVIGGLFAAVAGNDPALMWAAFPITVFVAAYAATTIGFMLSQAAFTINLILVFNLISPAGWQVGLVRLEDLIVGAFISLLVGLLLWPQGARRELARDLGDVYRSLIAYLDQAFDRVLGFETPGAVERAPQVVIGAQDRAGTSFETFLVERGADSSDQETAAFLLASANHMILAGDLLRLVAGPMGYSAETCADGAHAVREQVGTLLDAYRVLADLLSLSHAAERESQVSTTALRQAELGCLRRWQTDAGVGRGAMAVVMAGEWAESLARLEVDLEEAVSTTAGAARKPWWSR
ncbi:MAG TPA: FUSC family protein [Candidatus Dormibacteraeota bacterium]|nr:FUSC family protein [Candidatus Dormibacteraeota bacterium]